MFNNMYIVIISHVSAAKVQQKVRTKKKKTLRKYNKQPRKGHKLASQTLSIGLKGDENSPRGSRG